MTQPNLIDSATFDPSAHWQFDDGVTYLNNGSFGPSPRCVLESRQAWTERLEREPMDFILRQMETHLDAASEKLAHFLGAATKDLTFVDNATTGMNIVADSVKLQPGDEVLMNDHEYGAVLRIWQRVCRKAGAKVVTARLPFPLTSVEEVTESLMNSVTDRTRLIVVSHVTSPTAVILPVAEICRQARARRIPVCIDGPHAVAMLPVNLQKIGCDYYVASCHKWLCGPFGTGFLYVAQNRQSKLQPSVLSWGGSVSGRESTWKDEFRWIGTRDPSGFLAVSTAIDFMEQYGLEKFRTQTHAMAQSFRQRMVELTGLEPFVPNSSEWFGPMTAVPLPKLNGEIPVQGQRDPLQNALWDRYKIEIPVVHWHTHRLLRVSCHLYNTDEHLDRLLSAVSELLPEFSVR